MRSDPFVCDGVARLVQHAKVLSVESHIPRGKGRMCKPENAMRPVAFHTCEFPRFIEMDHGK